MMNMPFAPPLLEPDDLLHMTEGDRFELIDGRLQEKPVGAKADEIAGLLITMLTNHVRPAKLGRVYPDTGYVCFPHAPTRVRKPDVSFVARGRLTDDRSPDGFIPIRPDLVAESISPNDEYENVEERLNDFRKAGVPLVWVISPKSRTVLIRRADGTANLLDDTGTLSGEDVIPGFACPVADLFE